MRATIHSRPNQWGRTDGTKVVAHVAGHTSKQMVNVVAKIVHKDGEGTSQEGNTRTMNQLPHDVVNQSPPCIQVNMASNAYKASGVVIGVGVVSVFVAEVANIGKATAPRWGSNCS